MSEQDRRKFKLWYSILSFVSFRIPPRVESYHVFDKWHVAFYGTMIGRLRRILDLGDIPLQGKNSWHIPNPDHSFRCQTRYNNWTLRLACLVKSLSHFYWMFCFSSSRLVYFYIISSVCSGQQRSGTSNKENEVPQLCVSPTILCACETQAKRQE